MDGQNFENENNVTVDTTATEVSSTPGAGANKRKIPDSGKFLLLPLRDFSCGRGKVSAAQALPIWG